MVCPAGYNFAQLQQEFHAQVHAEPEPELAGPPMIMALPDNIDDLFDIQFGDEEVAIEAELGPDDVVVPPFSLVNPNESPAYNIEGRARNPPVMGKLLVIY